MKNKAENLNNILFESLERLSDPDTVLDLAREVAIAQTGKVLVDLAKAQLMYAKLTGEQSTDFFDHTTQKQLR